MPGLDPAEPDWWSRAADSRPRPDCDGGGSRCSDSRRCRRAGSKLEPAALLSPHLMTNAAGAVSVMRRRRVLWLGARRRAGYSGTNSRSSACASTSRSPRSDRLEPARRRRSSNAAGGRLAIATRSFGCGVAVVVSRSDRSSSSSFSPGRSPVNSMPISSSAQAGQPDHVARQFDDADRPRPSPGRRSARSRPWWRPAAPAGTPPGSS